MSDKMIKAVFNGNDEAEILRNALKVLADEWETNPALDFSARYVRDLRAVLAEPKSYREAVEALGPVYTSWSEAKSLNDEKTLEALRELAREPNFADAALGRACRHYLGNNHD